MCWILFIDSRMCYPKTFMLRSTQTYSLLFVFNFKQEEVWNDMCTWDLVTALYKSATHHNTLLHVCAFQLAFHHQIQVFRQCPYFNTFYVKYTYITLLRIPIYLLRITEPFSSNSNCHQFTAFIWLHNTSK